MLKTSIAILIAMPLLVSSVAFDRNARHHGHGHRSKHGGAGHGHDGKAG